MSVDHITRAIAPIIGKGVVENRYVLMNLKTSNGELIMILKYLITIGLREWI